MVWVLSAKSAGGQDSLCSKKRTPAGENRSKTKKKLEKQWVALGGIHALGLERTADKEKKRGGG